MKKFLLRFLILNCSFFILLSACSRKPAEGEPVPIPPVNDFTMKNLVSEFPGEIRTAKYAGKVQLVLFLRTDDLACRGSLPDWNGLHKEFAGRGFTIIGAVADERLPATLAAETAALDIAFPVGLAEAPVVTAFGGPGAIRAIPTAFLLDRDGNLVRAYAGFVPLAHLRDDIARLLDGQPLPPVPPARGATLPEQPAAPEEEP